MKTTPDDLAGWLFDRVGLAAKPPVNVDDLAARMGINQICNTAMIEDGRLEQTASSATIFVREGVPPTRRRFTIAHELAHRLLLHPRAPAERYRTRPDAGGDTEERLCDDIAAAILLPRDWVSANFSAAAQNLNSVRRLAAMTDTSMSASLVRLVEIFDWPQSLLRFRFVSGKWRLDAPAAVPYAMHGTIRTTADTNRVLNAIGQKSRRDTPADLPLRILDAECTSPAQISVSSAVAMALVDLHRRQPL